MISPRPIPKALWGHSGAKLLEPEAWRSIRADVLERADGRCEGCGAPARECDEVWNYYVQRRVAFLIGLRALCSPCHQVVHLGRTRRLEGEQAYQAALEHMAVTNGRTELPNKQELRVMTARFRPAGRVVAWEVRVVPDLLERLPQLRIVETGEEVSAAS